MTDWADKEAAKIRRKVAAWADTLCRTPQRVGKRGLMHEYAEAMGLSLAAATSLCEAHVAVIKKAARAEVGRAEVGRRVVDARPKPPGYDRPKDAHWDRIRRRVASLAQRNCYATGYVDPHKWPW